MELAATADSGLVVTFGTSTPGACTIQDTTLDLVATGTCTVTASQPGDETWAAAPDVEASLTIEPIAQAITFDLPTTGLVGDAIPLVATADSGLEVAFATTTPAICSITGSALQLDAPGTCSVTASQDGDATHAAADDAASVIAVQAPQVITFGLPSSGLVGATVPLTATADSGLAVVLASITPVTCSVTGLTLNLLAAGSCSVTASQPGDALHAAADDLVSTMTVKLSPLVSPDGTSLGRYGFNGAIRAMTVDPETGIAYVGGDFTAGRDPHRIRGRR